LNAKHYVRTKDNKVDIIIAKLIIHKLYSVK